MSFLSPPFSKNILLCSVHDFFKPQPVRNATLFLLRVVLHDWPDHLARRILLFLREAAVEGEKGTKLMIADFVLPLACVDDFGVGSRCKKDGGREGLEEVDNLSVEGAERALAPPPLLANLGKASSNVYFMDLTVSKLSSSYWQYFFLLINFFFLCKDASYVQQQRTNSPRDCRTGVVCRLESHQGHERSCVLVLTYRCGACSHSHAEASSCWIWICFARSWRSPQSWS